MNAINKRSLHLVLGPVLLGGVAGMAGSLVVAKLKVEASQPAALVQGSSESRRGIPVRRTDERMGDAGQRRHFTEAESKKRFENAVTQHKKALIDHDAEPVDPSWAPAAEARIATALAAAKTDLGKARVGSINCRTSTCTVDVEWPSYGDALTGVSPARLDYGEPCTRSIVTPPPDAAEGPYPATMFVRCRREHD